VAAPRKRNRQWEKQQQSRKVVYRGIDPKLALKVKAIADDLLVPAGEVACAVLEYALRSYERGDFDLHPRPNPERMRMTSSHEATPHIRSTDLNVLPNINDRKPCGGSSPPGAASLPNSNRNWQRWHPMMACMYPLGN
jgi:hypothetical protein